VARGRVAGGTRFEMPEGMLAVTADDLARRSRPGPRYTSYPTANHFHESFGASAAAAGLARTTAAAPDQSVGLYVHVPFCSSLCWYCGCNVTITRDPEAATAYVDLLLAELDLVARDLGRPVGQLSLGGGSPNTLSLDDTGRLLDGIRSRLGFTADAELHIELDPRRTGVRQIEGLAQLGFRRMSLGVQDFAGEVQDAIHRHQSIEQTAIVVGAGRDAGFTSINLDLIYGLPLQTPARFNDTLDQVLLLHPDRMAFFGYAHLPEQRPHQRLVERAGPLPGPTARAELLLLALDRARAAGYVKVGIDHVAAPDDELAIAATRGELDRNFQGYVAHHAPATIGLGASAISDTGDAYWQNHHDLRSWSAAVGKGQLPIERGLALNDDDRLRRQVITRLMCDGKLDAAAFERSSGVRFEDRFADELAAIARGDDADLAQWDPTARTLTTSAAGDLLVRNLCMAFDRYLPAAARAGNLVQLRHAPTV
jgi:oxygen-independent coproporphyrinogen III oxidase